MTLTETLAAIKTSMSKPQTDAPTAPTSSPRDRMLLLGYGR